MTRYIDADNMFANGFQNKTIELRMMDVMGSTIEKEISLIFKDAQAFIDSQPTVDVEIVRHGHWEPYEFGNECWHQCSKCNVADKFIELIGDKPGYKLVSKREYCPHCGAKMDEVVTE